MEKLTSLRGKIEKIDLRITTLLKERFKVVKKIGDLKEQNKSNIRDLQREKALLAKLLQSHEFKKNERIYIKKIFKFIFEKSCEVQEK
jgi:chorismate mutase